jgi:transposase
MSEEKEVSKTPKRIDVTKALKLRIQGNTLAEIGTIFGVSESAVCQSLKRFDAFLKDIQQGDLQAYTEERKSILNAAEMTLLRSCLQEDAIQKAPLASRVMAFGVLYDKRRLEEGKSTENLGILGKLIISSEDELGKSAKDKGSKNNDR